MSSCEGGTAQPAASKDTGYEKRWICWVSATNDCRDGFVVKQSLRCWTSRAAAPFMTLSQRTKASSDSRRATSSSSQTGSTTTGTRAWETAGLASSPSTTWRSWSLCLSEKSDPDPLHFRGMIRISLEKHERLCEAIGKATPLRSLILGWVQNKVGALVTHSRWGPLSGYEIL